MLEDRRCLVQEGARYVVTGEVSDLDVPETLQALVASRLDGWSAEERSLLQDASVLGVLVHHRGGRGPRRAARSARPRAAADGLVAKQVLARDEDPRSPERGQYAFLQALCGPSPTARWAGALARLAMSRRPASRAGWPGQLRDIAEVLASHYLEAIRAEPEANDVGASHRPREKPPRGCRTRGRVDWA